MVGNASFSVQNQSISPYSCLLTPEDTKEFLILQTHCLRYKGKKFFFDIEGTLDINEEPIFFINGAFQIRRSWFMFINHLKKNTLCITADLPGMGDADTIDEDTPFDYQAECVNEILRYLGFKKVNLMSASYGSPIAIRFAQMFPEKINKNILTGPLSEIPQYARTNIMQSLNYLDANDMEAFADQMITTLINTRKKKEIDKQPLACKVLGAIRKLTEKSKKHYIVASNRLLKQSVYSTKCSIEKNTFIFTGEFDHFTTPEYCFNIAQLFKNVQFTTIKRADHMYHLEQLDTAIFSIESFIRNKRCDFINNHYNLTGEK